jgi:hypothetical protein
LGLKGLDFSFFFLGRLVPSALHGGILDRWLGFAGIGRVAAIV